MNQLKNTAQKLQDLINFTELEGWSEEELATVVNLLHSELSKNGYSLSSDLLVKAMYPSSTNVDKTSNNKSSV